MAWSRSGPGDRNVIRFRAQVLALQSILDPALDLPSRSSARTIYHPTCGNANVSTSESRERNTHTSSLRGASHLRNNPRLVTKYFHDIANMVPRAEDVLL